MGATDLLIKPDFVVADLGSWGTPTGRWIRPTTPTSTILRSTCWKVATRRSTRNTRYRLLPPNARLPSSHNSHLPLPLTHTFSRTLAHASFCPPLTPHLPSSPNSHLNGCVILILCRHSSSLNYIWQLDDTWDLTGSSLARSLSLFLTPSSWCVRPTVYTLRELVRLKDKVSLLYSASHPNHLSNNTPTHWPSLPTLSNVTRCLTLSTYPTVTVPNRHWSQSACLRCPSLSPHWPVWNLWWYSDKRWSASASRFFMVRYLSGSVYPHNVIHNIGSPPPN